MIERLVSEPLIACRPAHAVEAFNIGFSDYVVPMTMTLEKFERRFRAEDVDPFASWVWFLDGAPVALLLVTRRGRVSRIGAIAIAPALRGHGLGRQICEGAIHAAQERGDTGLWLEVVEANIDAVNLYRRTGFSDHARLLGFRYHSERVADDVGHAREVALEEGLAIGCRDGGYAGLPWHLQVSTLAAGIAPIRCFVDRTDTTVVMIDDSGTDVRLTGLFVLGDTHAGPEFMSSLSALFPNRAWIASPLFLDQHASQFFLPTGWQEIELRQILMRHTLDR